MTRVLVGVLAGTVLASIVLAVTLGPRVLSEMRELERLREVCCPEVR